MTEGKKMQIKSEEISLDEKGRVVVNNPNLALAIQEHLKKEKTLGAPVNRLLDWNCGCDIDVDVDADCKK